MVAAGVGAIGVGQRIDPYLHIVDHVRNARISTVGAQQGVDQTKHQDVANCLVAMHRRGVHHLRFILLNGHVVADPGEQQRAPVDRVADIDNLAQVGIVSGELVHHVHVGIISGIDIPGLDALDEIAHDRFDQRRWVRQQLVDVSQSLEFCQLVFGGVRPDSAVLNVVD